MEFNGPDHVYRCIPPVLGNEKDESPVAVGLKVVAVPEIDRLQAECRGLGQEAIDKKNYEAIKSKVVFIENLKIDGQDVSDFDTFYQKAPPELVDWVTKAIFSTLHLTKAERKN